MLTKLLAKSVCDLKLYVSVLVWKIGIGVLGLKSFITNGGGVSFEDFPRYLESYFVQLL